MRQLSILLVPFAVFCFACGGGEDDGGGSAGSGGEAGNTGSANEGGSANGEGGTSGGSLDMHCEEMTSVEGACMCVNDVHDNWGPGEGIEGCSKTAVKSGSSYCCAGEGYPADDTCSCLPWHCSENSSGCYCGAYGVATTATICSKTYKTCCAAKTDGEVFMCMCSDAASCPSGQEVVADCSIAQASCHSDESKVDKCVTE